MRWVRWMAAERKTPGRWRHAQGGGLVFRQVVAVEARLVGVFQELQALLVQVGKLQPVPINPVEDTALHQRRVRARGHVVISHRVACYLSRACKCSQAHITYTCRPELPATGTMVPQSCLLIEALAETETCKHGVFPFPGGEGRAVLFSHSYPPSSSSNALASGRSAVSKPSVNQP
jgi:hypothetical protein